MDTDEVLGRFRYERQILAITEYCEQHGLGVEQRLALFQTVCRAVQ